MKGRQGQWTPTLVRKCSSFSDFLLHGAVLLLGQQDSWSLYDFPWDISLKCLAVSVETSPYIPGSRMCGQMLCLTTRQLSGLTSLWCTSPWRLGSTLESDLFLVPVTSDHRVLTRLCLHSQSVARLGASLHLHAWSFSLLSYCSPSPLRTASVMQLVHHPWLRVHIIRWTQTVS